MSNGRSKVCFWQKGDSGMRQMRVSVQTERVEKIGHQDQEYKPARLPNMF